MALKRVLIRLGRAASTLTVIAFAAFVGWRLWSYYMEAPWTRDGRVRADIVQIAADVSGLITEVPVRDNQHVRRGQLLLVVDRARYELALAQAEAELQTQKALLSEAELREIVISNWVRLSLRKAPSKARLASSN